MNSKCPLETEAEEPDMHLSVEPSTQRARIMGLVLQSVPVTQTVPVEKDVPIPREVPVTNDFSSSQNIPTTKDVPVAGSVPATDKVTTLLSGRDFAIPLTVSKLRSNRSKPWEIGYFIGLMLYHIPPLLTTHLDYGLEFKNPVPKALSAVGDFVVAVDAYIRHLRLTDGCSKKFHNDDRNAAKHRRKYIERYTYIVEAVFKNYICETLGDIIQAWSSQ
jgi:hypothetical protein